MLAQLGVKLFADISSLTGQLKKAQASLSNFSAQTGRIGSALSVSVTTPLALLGGTALKTAAEFEDLRTSFEVLTGSAEKGAKVFERLRNFAASTPFETAQLAKATKTMLSFGFTVEESSDTLRMLGDVAMGNGQKLDTLTLAFSRIVSNGKAMGQEINMMIDQGFNPLQILSEKTGKSMSVLKDEMAKGAITADMIRDAFVTATSEGGQFFGGMEKGSQTLSGVFSTFSDNVTGALAVLGEELVKTFDLKNLVKRATERIQDFVTAFQNLSDETKKNILAIGTVLGVGGPLYLAISALTRVMAMLNLKILVVVGVLALIGFAAQVLADNFDTLKKRTMFAFAGMTFAINDFLLSFINTEALLSLAAKTMGNSMTIGLNAIATGLVGMSNQLKSSRAKALEDMGAMKSAGLGTFTPLSESVGNFKDSLSVGLNNAFDFLLNTMMGFNQQADETAETIEGVKVNTDEATESTNKFKDVLKGLKQPLQDLTSAFIDAGITAFTQSLFNAGKFNTQELELRKINLQKQKEALNQSLAEQEISQREYGLRIALLNQELLDVETQINDERKNNFQKAMDSMMDAASQAVKVILAEFAKLAIIKGLLAIMGTPTSGVGKFFKEGLEGILGKARGGPVFSNQPYIVGERGPELFMPNRSGSIVPNGQLINSGTGMGTQAINLNGEFRIKGTDLVLTLAEANYKLGR
jgi:tape measure domain-containing protein